MADEKKQFQKRGSNFGRSNSQSRMNRHASDGRALIKDESELDGLLDQVKEPLILILRGGGGCRDYSEGQVGAGDGNGGGCELWWRLAHPHFSCHEFGAHHGES